MAGRRGRKTYRAPNGPVADRRPTWPPVLVTAGPDLDLTRTLRLSTEP
jgi:hypothetical protein